MSANPDVTLIQDEDVLRKMWQDTEDFGRKKEIRTHMYKLREARLTNFYNSGEVGKEIKGSTHADMLGDHSFLSLKSKEIRDSESPTRDVTFRDGGWNIVTSNERSDDGKQLTTKRSATTSGSHKFDGGKVDYAARNDQKTSMYQDGDENNFVKAVGAESHSVIKQEAVGGDQNSNFRSSSTKTSSSSRVVTESRSTSGDVVDNGRCIKSSGTQEIPGDVKNHPSYVEGKTKVFRETRTLADGTTVVTTRYETVGGTSSHTSSKVTSSTDNMRESRRSSVDSRVSRSEIEDQRNVSRSNTINEQRSRPIEDQRKVYKETRTLADGSTVTTERHTSSVSNLESKTSRSTVEDEQRSRPVQDQTRIYKETRTLADGSTVTTTEHHNSSARNLDSKTSRDTVVLEQRARPAEDQSKVSKDTKSTITEHHSSAKNIVEDRTTMDQKPTYTTIKTTTIYNELEPTTILIKADNKKATNEFISLEKQQSTKQQESTIKQQESTLKQQESTVKQQESRPKQQESRPSPEKRQPIKPGKSELDRKPEPTEGQYDTTYRSEFTPKKISVEVSPTHDAFARSLRAVSPDRVSHRSLRTSTSSLRSSTSPEKIRHPTRYSPDRRTTSSETITIRRNKNYEITTDLDEVRSTSKKDVRPTSLEITTKKTKKITERSPTSPLTDFARSPSKELPRRNSYKSPTPKKELPKDRPLKRTDTYEERCRQILGITETAQERRRSSLEKATLRRDSLTKTVTRKSPTKTVPSRKSPEKRPSQELLRKSPEKSVPQFRKSPESNKTKPAVQEFPSQIRKSHDREPLETYPEKQRPQKTGPGISEFPSQVRRSAERAPLEQYPEKRRPSKTSPSIEEFPSQIRKSQEREPLEPYPEKQRPQKTSPTICEFPSQIRRSPEREPLEQYPEKRHPSKTSPSIEEFPSQIRKSQEREPLEPYPEKQRPQKTGPTICEFPSQIRRSPEREPLEPYPEKRRPSKTSPSLEEFPSQIRKSQEREPLEPYPEKQRPRKTGPTIGEFPSQIRRSPEREPLEPYPEKRRPSKTSPSIEEFPSQIRKSQEKEPLEPYPEKKIHEKTAPTICEFPSQVRRSPEREPLEPYPEKRRPSKTSPSIEEFPSQIRKSQDREPLEPYPEKKIPAKTAPTICEFPSQVRRSPEREPLEPYPEKRRPSKTSPSIEEFPSQIRKSQEREPLEPYPEKQRPQKTGPTICEFPSQIRRSPEREPLEPYPEKRRPSKTSPSIEEFPSQIRKSQDREPLEPYPEKQRPTKTAPTISEFPSHVRRSPEREPLEPYPEKRRPSRTSPSIEEIPSQIKKSQGREPLEKQKPGKTTSKVPEPGKRRPINAKPLTNAKTTPQKKKPVAKQPISSSTSSSEEEDTVEEVLTATVNEPLATERFISKLCREDEVKTKKTKQSVEKLLEEEIKASKPLIKKSPTKKTYIPNKKPVETPKKTTLWNVENLSKAKKVSSIHIRTHRVDDRKTQPKKPAVIPLTGKSKPKKLPNGHISTEEESDLDLVTNKTNKVTRTTSDQIIKTQTKPRTPIRGFSKPELISKPTKTTKCITTKSIIINNNKSSDQREVVIDLLRSKSSREPSPDRLCPLPVSSDEEGLIPRYPDEVQEPDDANLRRKPKKLSDIPIMESEDNYQFTRITDITDNKKITEVDRVEETDDSLLTVEKKISKFLTTAEEVTKKPFKSPAPKIKRPEFEVNEELKSDECLLSVSDKVSKFITTAEQLIVDRPKSPICRNYLDDEEFTNVEVQKKVSHFVNTAEDSVKTTKKSGDYVPRPQFEDLDDKIKDDHCLLSVSDKVTKFISTADTLIKPISGSEPRRSLSKSPSPSRISPSRISPSRISPSRTTPSRTNQQYPESTPKTTRKPSPTELRTTKKPDVSTTTRLRGNESVKRAKAMFENITKEQEILKQRDILSRPSVFEARKLQKKRLSFSDDEETTIKKSDTTLKSTKLVIDKMFRNDKVPDIVTTDVQDRSDRESSPEGDLPGYMKPLDRSLRPNSPHRDSLNQIKKEPIETKFGVTLKRTDSGRTGNTVTTIGNTVTTTERRKSSITLEKRVTEEEVEEIFELEILEELLEKVVGYDLRRKIRTQIRLVKKLIQENKLSEYIRNRSTSTTTKFKPFKPEEEKKKVSPERKTTEYVHRRSSPERKTTTKTEYQTEYIRKSSPERKTLKTTTEYQTDYIRKSSPERKTTTKTEYQTEYIRKTSPERKQSTEYVPRKSSPERKTTKTEYQTDYIRKTSPERKQSTEYIHRRSSPERKTIIKSEYQTEYIRKSSPERKTVDQKLYNHTDLISRRDDSIKKTEYQEKISRRSPSPRKVTQPKKFVPADDKPEWVKQRNLRKVTDTSSPIKRVTTARKVPEKAPSPQKDVKPTDIITSSYGVGPTDENGAPLFGLRALRAQNKTEKTKVQGTVVRSEYYSENGNEPVGQISVTKYSSDPKDLGSNNKGLTSVTTTQKFGYRDTPTLRSLSDKKNESTSTTTKTTTSKVTRRGSVKQLSQKFIDNAVETLKNEKQSSYPKAGLILRTSSFKGTGDSGESRESSPVEENSFTTVKTTQSFLTNRSEVTGMQDIIGRMKAEDYEVEGDTEEDIKAKALLNKFLGAQVILNTIEGSASKISSTTSTPRNIKRTTKVTSTITERGKPRTVERIFQRPVTEADLETVWDEQTIRLLLDQSSDYEERRILRARLRQVMAEQEACTQLVEKASQEQSGGGIEEKVETTKKTFSTGPVTTTQVTTRVTTQQTAKKPISPFAKFRQLDKQNSLPSSPSTPKTPSGSGPLFKFTDPALSQSANTIKERLLYWCKQKTREYENIQLDNFSTSWADGLAFCALVHHFLPDAFDYSALSPKNRRHNFTLAFRVADEKADIAPLLDVDDMVACRKPDWKCVFTYVQSIYRRFKDED